MRALCGPPLPVAVSALGQRTMLITRMSLVVVEWYIPSYVHRMKIYQGLIQRPAIFSHHRDGVGTVVYLLQTRGVHRLVQQRLNVSLCWLCAAPLIDQTGLHRPPDRLALERSHCYLL